MMIRFGPWLPFEQEYQYRPGFARSGMFMPRTRTLTERCAGLYLIADSRRASLQQPESVIYLGRSSGIKALSTFHMRLWKHCCKAIGECSLRQERSEPKDTRNWKKYRDASFRGPEDFDHWYFSVAKVGGDELLASLSMKEAESAALHAYERQTGALPSCNDMRTRSLSGSFRIIFPWEDEAPRP